MPSASAAGKRSASARGRGASRATRGEDGKKASKASSSSAFLTLDPIPLSSDDVRPAGHDERYHVPHLLASSAAQDALLGWFERTQTARDMPWRKDWVDPHRHLTHAERSRRGYEVLVSETMLQQTRIETVKTYYANWMARFPTVEALAVAKADEVMAAWSGLGYYSRATRLHAAAKTIHERYDNVLPSDPAELEKEIAGVGRYTAGAISSIVYGVATPLLDGNVARVLSRQMALHADIKSKTVTDVLWRAAELLVLAVSRAKLAQDDDEDGKDTVQPSAIPGQWNQALMELGSTVCMPFPRCGECPIRSSCRAYAEGRALATRQTTKRKGDVATEQGSSIEDIESLCTMCESMPSLEEELGDLSDEEDGSTSTSRPSKKAKNANAAPVGPKLRQSTLSFAPVRGTDGQDSKTSFEPSPAPEMAMASSAGGVDAATSKVIQAHVRQFPLKVAKKKIREEDAVVCIIEARVVTGADDAKAKSAKGGKRKAATGGGRGTQSFFLIRQRPDKGLLASMWEMPTYIFDEMDEERTEDDRIKAARSYTLSVLKDAGLPDGRSIPKPSTALHQVESLGVHTHVYSHLKSHLHAIHVVVEVGTVDVRAKGGRDGKWVSDAELERDYSLGNGMKTCWGMLKDATE